MKKYVKIKMSVTLFDQSVLLKSGIELPDMPLSSAYDNTLV